MFHRWQVCILRFTSLASILCDTFLALLALCFMTQHYKISALSGVTLGQCKSYFNVDLTCFSIFFISFFYIKVLWEKFQVLNQAMVQRYRFHTKTFLCFKYLHQKWKNKFIQYRLSSFTYVYFSPKFDLFIS